MIADEAPPGMIAFKVEPSRMPPQYSSSSALKVMPIGASKTPVFFEWPLTANRRGPPFFGIRPTRLNAAPPMFTITGGFARVSPVFTAVGRVENPPPPVAGDGGLTAG